MKIRAIRVAECGRFREPVAVEGFSGGLDVLVGPNEAGKSTLLRALRLALSQPHTANNKDVRLLVSYGASAPLIEVDFEADGQQWRLRKRFLNQKAAELSALSGAVKLRGADAEARLTALLGHGGDARLEMLWLAQGAMLGAAQSPTPPGQTLITSLIASEIETAAGGDGVRRIHAQVKARLGEHLSGKQERKRGRYLALEQSARAAAEAHDAARRRHAEVESLIEKLAGLSETVAALVDPATVEARRLRIAAADDALAAAHTAIAERDGMRATLAEARGLNEAAQGAAKRLAAAIAERDGLAAQTTRDTEARRALTAALAETRQRAAESQCAADAARRRTDELAAEAAWARAETMAVDRRGRLARAEAAAHRAATLGAQLDAEPIEPGAVAQARTLANRIGEAAARLEAQSAMIVVAYEPGQSGRIRADGVPLADGVGVTADRPLVLDIPGIGRITVTPGRSADRDALSAALAGDRHRLRDLLARAGVDDVAALAAREATHHQALAARAEALSELKGLAPEGLEGLVAEVGEAERATGEARARLAGLAGPRTLPLIEAEVARLGPQLAEATARLREAQADEARLDREEAHLSATIAERQRRLAEVDAGLPPPTGIGAHRAQLEAEAAAASRSYDEAARAHHAASARAPDAAGLARLEAELAAASEAGRKAEQQLHALEGERARVSGQLEGSGDEDIAGTLASRAAEAERTAAALADLAEEVAALQLLDAELGAASEAVKARFIAPVTARIEPYLAEIFPGAEIALGDGYGAKGFVRDNGTEEVERLSDGTREQIAVLVRLGLARLLAEQGHAAPLILDDALVYSDDERVIAMHRALQAAARVHQVIVLSCREPALAGLGGQKLAIVPWIVA